MKVYYITASDGKHTINFLLRGLNKLLIREEMNSIIEKVFDTKIGIQVRIKDTKIREK